MEFHMKLPRNGKEFLVFLIILSVLSVNIIAPFITMLEMGFSLKNWQNTFQVMPYIWIVVVILVLLTHNPATKISNKLIKKDDSFNAHMIVSCLVNAFIMSIVLTIVATWIGMGKITTILFQTFPNNWPRNFAIAFFVEAIIAQPIARFIILKMHRHIDAKDTKAFF